jgi:uracil-DNA glycosylase
VLEVDRLLKSMYREYAESVGLSPDANYFNGTPLRPVVPLDHGTEAVFFLGAYPSSRFVAFKNLTDVPAGDNLGPFESERWFDGSRVRSQLSARELEDYFLNPMELTRESCWITDLVKVFLFKDGHSARYTELGFVAPPGYERARFHELGIKSLPWIRKELELARPRLVITLGAEVAGVVRGVNPGNRQTALLKPKVEDVEIAGYSVPTIHCAHPGILMRPSEQNAWPSRHNEEFLPVIRRFLGSTVRTT